MADNRNTGGLSDAQLLQLLTQLQRIGGGNLGGLPGLPQPGQVGAQSFGTGTAAPGAARPRQQQFFPAPLTGQVPGSQSFAPTTQFTGGSPFPVDDTAQILQNLFILLGGAEGLEKVLKGTASTAGQGLADAGSFLGDVGKGAGDIGTQIFDFFASPFTGI